MKEAIVLAGGFGTRLRQVVPDMPKPMAPVAGKPFLEILLSTLARKGFTRVILSLGFMSEKIISHFDISYCGMELVYEVEHLPLGTGGAIRAGLMRCISDHAFVFNGDTYLDLDVSEVERLWASCLCPIVVVREVADTARYGRIEIQNGRVVTFLEKGIHGAGLINAGCYVFSKTALDSFPSGYAFSLESEFLSREITNQDIRGYITRGHFIDIGVPEDFARAQVELAGV